MTAHIRFIEGFFHGSRIKEVAFRSEAQGAVKETMKHHPVILITRETPAKNKTKTQKVPKMTINPNRTMNPKHQD